MRVTQPIAVSLWSSAAPLPARPRPRACLAGALIRAAAACVTSSVLYTAALADRCSVSVALLRNLQEMLGCASPISCMTYKIVCSRPKQTRLAEAERNSTHPSQRMQHLKLSKVCAAEGARGGRTRGAGMVMDASIMLRWLLSTAAARIEFSRALPATVSRDRAWHLQGAEGRTPASMETAA